MQESVYRQRVQDLFRRIETGLEKANIDPDLIECESAHGALTLRFSNGSKCILSTQPSIRQLWMAVAAKGVAFHFSYNETLGQWQDDKGGNIEPLAYLSSHIQELTGISITF